MLGECCGSSRQNPIVVTINDRVTKSEVQVPIGADALRRILVPGIGDGNDFPAFPALLLTIDRGDPSILSWFVEKRYNQITAGAKRRSLWLDESAVYRDICGRSPDQAK